MLCVFSLLACSNEKDESDSGLIKKGYTISAIIELNENSNMGLELLCDMSDKEYTKIEEEDERTRVYGGYFFTTGFCGVYPKNEKKSVITTIFINDSKCDIYGIKKGDSVNVIQDVISKHNYSLEDDTESNGLRYISYQKGDIRIVFACEEDSIISMAVDVMGYEDIYEEMLTVDGDIITEYSLNVVEELNENSNMGLELLSDMSDRKYKKTFFSDGTVKVYSGYYLTTGICGKYPDNIEKEVITSISIEGSKCHVFGIKEGDGNRVIDDIMLQYDYYKQWEKVYPDGYVIVIYRKGDVAIKYEYDREYDESIGTISVHVSRYDETPEEDIVY